MTLTKQLNIVLFSITYLFSVSCNNSNVAANKTTDTTIASKENTPPPPPIDPDKVKFERKPMVYDSTKTYVYLTFDDGPHGGTKECLELCKKLGIKATFFMVGRHANDKWGKQLVHEIKQSYPQILLANHSYTHANEKYKYFYQHPDMATQDFYKAQDSLHVPYKIVRLPGNSAWVGRGTMKAHPLVKPVCEKLDSAGYNVIGWDVEWNFTRGQSFPVQTPAKVASEVFYAAQNHSHTAKHVMILTHDRMFRTPAYADSLAKFIGIIKQNPNYVFETVDNYPNLKFGL
ncbi:MAG: polysaccharide deacetylase family protein [Chitinophagaceae bacterium]|jgi:peptidoglycan/xylan/chitin deacetylase (PgdA/CDA1 family)|nr:polysaccharide deacetylase family protein [Chitinophagaceae bacterium]